MSRSDSRTLKIGTVLLNPGPVNTSARVKNALLGHEVCHRDEGFANDFGRVTNKLVKVFRGSAEHTCLIVTGSGTASMEASITTAMPHGKKILVVDNGAFGERLAEISRLHEIEVVHIKHAYGEQVRVAEVRAALAADPDIAAVAMCHHETSVGVLNPVFEIGQICREADRLFLVDAVSALGAEDVNVVRDNVDLCWSSSNKCLHAAAGISFVCVSPRVWERVANIKPRVYYLDLRRYRAYLDEQSQTPFTPAVGTIYALEAALDEYFEEGADARHAVYAERNRRLRGGLRKLGLAPFTETGRESHSVVTIGLPAGVSFEDLYSELKDRGYIIYDCKAPLKGRFFQVANMGHLAEGTLERFLESLAAGIRVLTPAAARAV